MRAYQCRRRITVVHSELDDAIRRQHYRELEKQRRQQAIPCELLLKQQDHALGLGVVQVVDGGKLRRHLLQHLALVKRERYASAFRFPEVNLELEHWLGQVVGLELTEQGALQPH